MDFFEWLEEIIITSIVANGSKGKIPNGWDIARAIAFGEDFDGHTRDERASWLKEFLRTHP